MLDFTHGQIWLTALAALVIVVALVANRRLLGRKGRFFLLVDESAAQTQAQLDVVHAAIEQILGSEALSGRKVTVVGFAADGRPRITRILGDDEGDLYEIRRIRAGRPRGACDYADGLGVVLEHIRITGERNVAATVFTSGLRSEPMPARTFSEVLAARQAHGLVLRVMEVEGDEQVASGYSPGYVDLVTLADSVDARPSRPHPIR